MSNVKSFLKWTWEIGTELPRNFRSKSLRTPVANREIVTFSIDVVKTLLAESPDTLRLYLVLMLNCGFQQTDIAELEHGEVDWTSGRIARKRSKTGEFASITTV